VCTEAWYKFGHCSVLKGTFCCHGAKQIYFCQGQYVECTDSQLPWSSFIIITNRHSQANRNLYVHVFGIRLCIPNDAYFFPPERWLYLNSLDFPSSFGASVSQVRQYTGLYLYIVYLSSRSNSIFAALNCILQHLPLDQRHANFVLGQLLEVGTSTLLFDSFELLCAMQ